MKFECSDCMREFKTSHTLQRHRRIQHNVIIRCRNKEYICATCGTSYNAKFRLSNHMKEHLPESRKKRLRLICPEDNCSYSPVSYKKLQLHLREHHKVSLKHQNMNFSSENEFLLWKRNIEKEEYSSFILNCGTTRTKNGWTKYFVCHRSYEYRSTGIVNRKRKLKSTGSNKTGISCPATIVLKKSNCHDAFFVEYIGTHRGHSCDIVRTNLSVDDKNSIAEKIKEGASLQFILDEVRNSAASDNLKRIHLLGRRDLHNIRRDYNIGYPTKIHNDNGASVHLWVKSVQTKYPENSPILFYKPAHEEHRLLQENDFALCLMTEFQEAAFLKFGHDIICVDGVRSLNPYGIFLITIVVVDEFGTGVPVAFCFANREDYTMMKIFFEAIETRIGKIAANAFMSNGAASFYNAWQDVMQPVNHQLLCSWLVNKNWCSNLSQKIKNLAKRELVRKHLKTLQQETDIQTFQMFLSNFLQKLKQDPDMIEFHNYFENTYSHEPEKWATCFILYTGINTNLYLLSLHKEIKQLYLDGKKVVRLDKAVNALLLLVRDKLFKRLTHFCRHKKSEKMARIHESHLKGEQLVGNVCITDEPNTWLVKSEKNDWAYVVKKLQEECEETSCSFKCFTCNCCVHVYQCQCNDNMIYMDMCKHIHACIQKFNPSNQQSFDRLLLTTDTEKTMDLLLPLENNDRNEDIRKRMRILLGIVEGVNYSDEQCHQLKKYLSKALAVASGSKKNQ